MEICRMSCVVFVISVQIFVEIDFLNVVEFRSSCGYFLCSQNFENCQCSEWQGRWFGRWNYFVRCNRIDPGYRIAGDHSFLGYSPDSSCGTDCSCLGCNSADCNFVNFLSFDNAASYPFERLNYCDSLG